MKGKTQKNKVRNKQDKLLTHKSAQSVLFLLLKNGMIFTDLSDKYF